MTPYQVWVWWSNCWLDQLTCQTKYWSSLTRSKSILPPWSYREVQKPPWTLKPDKIPPWTFKAARPDPPGCFATGFSCWTRNAGRLTLLTAALASERVIIPCTLRPCASLSPSHFSFPNLARTLDKGGNTSWCGGVVGAWFHPPGFKS